MIVVVVVGAVVAVLYARYNSPTNKALRNQARDRARNTERSKARRSQHAGDSHGQRSTRQLD